MLATDSHAIDLIRDWELEKKFFKAIKGILGNYFIVQDITEDLEEATDFLIFSVDSFRVAARLRRYEYFEYNEGEYRRQFTIRYSRPSGVKTELAKIREGKVDYLIYGFVDNAEVKIIQYFIADLDIFRKVDPRPMRIYPNDPPDSYFAVYSLAQMGPDFVGKFWTGNGY